MYGCGGLQSFAVQFAGKQKTEEQQQSLDLTSSPLMHTHGNRFVDIVTFNN